MVMIELTEKRYVYILESYAFYDCMSTIMISEDIDYLKKYLNEMNKENGYGYRIMEYEYNKLYTCLKDGKSIVWIEKEYDGKIKNMKDGD